MLARSLRHEDAVCALRASQASQRLARDYISLALKRLQSAPTARICLSSDM